MWPQIRLTLTTKEERLPLMHSVICFVAKSFQVETIWTKVDTIGCAILNLLGCATQSASKKDHLAAFHLIIG